MAQSKVYPSAPIAEQIVKLSICDAYSPKVWVTQTHFWPLQDSSHAQRSYEILREGLSRTLSEIPALAGTIGRTSDDPRDLVINVDGDAHVEFAWEDLTTRADIPAYSELKANGFPLTDLVAPFSQPITLSPLFEGARMVTAKLNYLKGGLALSFGFNHLLADASTVAEVERIWSLHCSDFSNGVRQTHKPVVDETAIRERLSAPVSLWAVGVFDDEHWKVFPTAHSQLNLPREAVTKEAALTVLQETKNAHLASLNGASEETKWCMWKFSAENLAKLKKDAGPDSTKWISTMDALVALFWSRLAFAKQKSKDGHAESLVLFPINIRSRLQPPIETQYVGNAVDIITTTCSLPALESDTGLLTAAQCMRQAVTGWKESKWAAWLTMAAGLPNDQAICPNPLALLAQHNMGFNDYSKSQSNVLNWGPELGVIDRTRYMKPASSLANCATAVIVHPRLADGALEVAATCTQHIRSMLEGDKVFSTYGEFVTTYT